MIMLYTLIRYIFYYGKLFAAGNEDLDKVNIISWQKKDVGLKSSMHRWYEVSQAWLAQLVEQRTENPRVSGSIPELGMCFSIKPCKKENRYLKRNVCISIKVSVFFFIRRMPYSEMKQSEIELLWLYARKGRKARYSEAKSSCHGFKQVKGRGRDIAKRNRAVMALSK